MPAAVPPSAGWLGRVVNAMGEPIDGKGPLPPGPSSAPFRNAPPPAHARRRVGAPHDLGVRAVNTFLTCCRGQRLGIFAGSGVGKSVLLSMLARNVMADVPVIGLVGERGREVQEFLQDDLGPAGLARSVGVVSTSDEPALMRRQAAYVTLAIAESFRDEGKDVLVLMDSITRFAITGFPPARSPRQGSSFGLTLRRAKAGRKRSCASTLANRGNRKLTLSWQDRPWCGGAMLPASFRVGRSKRPSRLRGVRVDEVA